jgi:DNA-directed RNA polymerase specialized sigma24 family protein
MRRRLARRQERAFERSYRRHVGDVYHYALGMLRDPLDAEEVTHTTFLNAYRVFRQKGGSRPSLNALLAIAHDVCRLRSGYQVLAEAEILPGDDATTARQALREELEVSLTCHEAELGVSRQLDNRLSRTERRSLRAHVRSCQQCEAFAHGQQAQRVAIRALASIPLPEGLQSFLECGRGRVSVQVAARIAALAGTTALVVALLSSAGVPNPSRFIGQEREPEARAAVVKPVQPRKPKTAKKGKKPKRKFHRRATSP